MNSFTIIRPPCSTATLFIVIICLVSVCWVPAATAWTISSVSIDPSGSLVPGTLVAVTAKIEPSMENELRFTTDLANARWTCSLISDRKKSWIPGGPITATIFDWCPANLNEVKEPFRLTMEGAAPAVQHTTNISVLEIGEYDSRNSLIKSVRYSAIVVNVREIQDRIKKMDERLAALRSHIDEKNAIGVNTIPAEEQYHLAWSNISTSCCKSSRDVDDSEKRLI